ncbi:MAG TPA: hypothetical protein VLX91_04025 [Candidatus Acidoferrales bacterium]|nr:hypothetical protein [Candidatus Acidoferrales bacterium]
MKKETNVSILFCISMMLMFMGCSGLNKPPKELNLVIVVADRLGSEKTDIIPDKIRQLCFPIGCEQYNILPIPRLHRLGYDRSSDLSLETVIEEGAAGNKANINFLTNKVKRHLANVEIGESFSKENDKNIDIKRAYDEYLSAVDTSSMAILTSNESLKNIGMKIFTDVDSVRAWIAALICNQDYSSITLFVEPPIDKSSHPNISTPSKPSLDQRNARLRTDRQVIAFGGGTVVYTPGEIPVERVEVYNEGGAIGKISLDGKTGPNADCFDIQPSNYFRIPGGKRDTLYFRFLPRFANPGEKSTTTQLSTKIRFRTNDPRNPMIEFDLSGKVQW